MKVRRPVLRWPALAGRVLVTIPLSMVLTIAVHTAPASAITRTEVLSRAHHWIKKRVYYSQSSSYQGYRRDCSGFVSMAWKLKSSYTSSSIVSTARRIKWSRLKPGDAVRRSGHVEIFAGWRDRRHRRYYALEESTYGRPALRAVKTFKSGYMALRRRGIVDDLTVRVAPPQPPAPPTPPASQPTSPGVDPSAGATLTAIPAL